MTRDEYSRRMNAELTAMTPEKKELVNNVLAAEGLIKPGSDYFKALGNFVGQSVGGYLSGTDTIYISINPSDSSLRQADTLTVFHELVHAMQDQYYNLQKIDSLSIGNTDRSFAHRFIIEGEAEIVSDWYARQRYYHEEQPTLDSLLLMVAIRKIQLLIITELQHWSGLPYVAIQPYCESYVYGALFLLSVCQTELSLLDEKVYPRMPEKTASLYLPQFDASSIKAFNYRPIDAYLNSAAELCDADQFGEVYTRVLFNEWGFANYDTIASGIVDDKVFVYRCKSGTFCRFAWYTSWVDTADAVEFMNNYLTLLRKKQSVTLQQPVLEGTSLIAEDPAATMYVERFGPRVLILENYDKETKPTLVALFRELRPNDPAVTKTTGTSLALPHIDKRALGRWFLPRPLGSQR